jgi:uncharacterized protein YodC (DUF2158 family)
MTIPEPFKTGDAVRLVSGGPPMTVQLVTDALVYCLWFAGTALRTNAFAPAALVRTTLKPGERVPDPFSDN